MSQIEVLAPAKINLFLHVIGRRSDGYHELQSVFRTLDLADRVSVAVAPGSARVDISAPASLGAKEDNLAWKAAVRFLEVTDWRVDVSIRLDKRIPVGAGLGGGSSDAAAVLEALNRLSGGLATGNQLFAIALSLGADVPFFLQGGSAWVEGIGESIQAIELGPRWYLLVNPRIHISTQEIFQAEELTRCHEVRTIAAFLSREAQEENWVNDLEPVVCSRFEEVRALQRWFRQYGAAKMSGSGSTFFLECESEQQARAIEKAVPNEWWHFVAQSQ